ncbi:hypothetical protein Tco_0396692 [Tanacetum coccineum]
MGTLSLVSEYLKDLEECMDDGDSRVAKEAKLFDALKHKSVVIEVDNKKIAIFTKTPLWAFGEPLMRYSLPCKVDGEGAWDAELDLADSTNYVTEKVLENMGFVHDLEECMDDGDSRVAKEAKLFNALEHKSVVIEVDNQKITIFTKATLRAFGEPFIRYSLPCKVDGQGAWDAELDLADSVNYVTEKVLENMGFVHVSLSDYGRKMVNDVNVEIHGVKFKADFVVLDYVNEGEPSILFGRDFLATTKSQLSEEVVKMGKANRNKGYNINKLTPLPSLRLEEIPPTSTIPPQPIYHPLTPKQKDKMKEKKLDEILKGKERLNKKKFSEEDKVGIIKHGLHKKMCDPENYVLPVKINGVVEMVALVDTGASAMGEVKNVRIQIGYQAYVVDLLILDILVDLELPLLLGRPFFRTCGAIIDMGRGEDDWLGSFEVGRDEDGNVKYGLVAPSFIDIEDDIERVLAMEAYFNPFKNVIVFKKLVDFLGSLPMQLKNLDWGNEGYETYKKVDGDEDWHARFEIVTPSGRKFNRAFKTKTTTRKLSGKFKTEDVFRSFGVPRVANRHLFDGYGFEDTLREMMKLEYIYKGDGDIFVDYSWERALSIDNEIYLEWVWEFFSTLYLDKDVDRNNLMKEKCIWFRLCGHEHILTLPEFAIVLGLFTEDEEMMQKRDLWMMSTSEESRRVNLAWIIADHLYKHASGTKENSVICAGHYVTKIACFLGYYVDDEIKKCSKLIDCEYWISKMLADELDVENTCLKKETEMPTQAEEGSSEPRQEHGGLNSSWGDWNASLRGSYGLGGDDYFTSAMPDFGGSSSGYAVGGSSRGAGFNDDDDMDE